MAGGGGKRRKAATSSGRSQRSFQGDWVSQALEKMRHRVRDEVALRTPIIDCSPDTPDTELELLQAGAMAVAAFAVIFGILASEMTRALTPMMMLSRRYLAVPNGQLSWRRTASVSCTSSQSPESNTLYFSMTEMYQSSPLLNAEAPLTT